MSRLTALRLAVAATLVTACTGAAIIASQKSAATMQKAATQFLDSLSADQKARASFPFESEERLRWHFIPNEMFPRKGLMIKDMNEAQRRLAHDLLRSGLSARGYLKVTSIIELEDILKAIDAGADDVKIESEFIEVYTAPTELDIVRKQLDAAGLKITSAELFMLPKQSTPLDDKTALQALRLLDQIEDLDDVQKVYSNGDFPESALMEYASA